MSKKVVAMAVAGLAMLGSNMVFAADCPLEPYKSGVQEPFIPGNVHTTITTSGAPLAVDDEFGNGAQANTECVTKQGKLVIQVDAANVTDPGKSPWVSTYGFFLRNYAIQGIEAGKDVKVAVVLSASGALLGMKSQEEGGVADNKDAYDNAANVAKVKDALNRGFEIYVCQTAARGLGIKQSDLIEGVKFTPGGHLMVANKQMDGYAHLIYK